MKKVIANFVLFFLLLILIGIYLLFKFKPFQESKKIFDVKAGSVVEINIRTNDEEMLFSKENNEWVMVKPDNYKIDEKKVVELENIINNLTLERVIEKKSTDLASYGLDDPTMTITIKLKNGIEKSLIVGGESVSKTQYYAAKKISKSGVTDVFTIGKGYMDIFSSGSNEYRDKSILTVELTNLEKLNFINSTGEELEFEKNQSAGNEWSFTAPFKAKVKGDAFAEILRNLGRLEIEEYIKIKPDALQEYGLKIPEYKIIFKDSNGLTQTLSFGRDVDNKIYILTDNSEEIYTVSDNIFKPEDIWVGELIDFAPLSIGIDNVEKVVVDDSGSRYEFERDDSGQGNSFSINGKKVSDEAFTSLYVNIMALSAEGYDDSRYIKKPDLTITLNVKERSKEVNMSFTKRTNDTYFMVLNDIPLPFYIKENKVELVRSWVKRILISG